MSYLIDTNVLVYTVDPADPAKRQRAGDLLDLLGERSSGALSAQALAEFCNSTVRKLRLEPSGVAAYVRQFERLFPVHPVTAAVVLEALRGVREYRLAYYDAQVWASARLSGIETVLSEDFNPGSRLEGVAFVNPFEASFDLAELS